MLGNPFDALRRPAFIIEPLEQEDTREAARIHAARFAQPWPRDDIQGLLSQPTVFGFVARREGRRKEGAGGFVLARLAADEAEILTIAVDAAFQRQGIGHQLMDAVLRHLHGARAQALFLEVDEGNIAAIGLYQGLGFITVGKRPDYYSSGNSRSTALTMRRDF
ncbi:MAG: GNAT family N-acetyltransferase [Phyllobacterium sp.]